MAKDKFEDVAAVIPDDGETSGTPGSDGRPAHISEEDWNGLTEAEREGILTPDDELDDKAPGGGLFDDETLAKIAGTDEEEEQVAAAVKAVAAPEAVEADKAVEAESAATAPVPEVSGEVAATEAPNGEFPTDEELLAFRPTVSESELTITDEVPAAIQAKMDELDARFENAEVTAQVYNREMQALNRQVMSSQISQRDATREDLIWDKEQRQFFSARPMYAGNDLKGKALYGALNEAIQAVGNDPKYANASSGMQILVEADRAVRDAFGLQPGKAPALPAKAAPAPAPGKPPAPRPEVKTLANVPTAAADTSLADPFAALDALSGEAYERALERLTPDQRERYLSA